MNDFSNKNILLITAQFFGYEKALQNQLKKRGARVWYYDERPSNKNLHKGIIRVAPFLLKGKTKRYYQTILEELKTEKIDYFLLIKGEATPFFFLKQFRQQHPETQCIFYAYDSVTEYPKFLKLNSYFDKNFTFEARDAQQYNLHFRPLFYIDEYAQPKVKSNGSTLYDISFVGSAHTDRFTVGENIRKVADKMGLKTFFYYYAPSKIIFYLKRIFDPYFKKFDIRQVKFQSISHKDLAEIYQNSFAVLDINKPFQLGLSMRPFETFVAQKKLITTNPEIVNYPFYHPNNILVLDRDNIDIPISFFQTDFQPLSDELLEKISLDSWLDAIFLQPQDEYWKWWE